MAGNPLFHLFRDRSGAHTAPMSVVAGERTACTSH